MDQFESFETKRFVQRLLGKVLGRGERGDLRARMPAAGRMVQCTCGSKHPALEPLSSS